MKKSGVSGGFTDGTFRPTATVDRQAMAAFLFRAQHPGAVKPRCSTAPFKDVALDNAYCGEISWLKEQKLTTGYRDGTFRPSEKISRQAVAAVAFRALRTPPTEN